MGFRGRDFLIKIPVGKSCFILLTPEEYERGIERGKAARRRKQFQEREAKRRGAMRVRCEEIKGTGGRPAKQWSAN